MPSSSSTSTGPLARRPLPDPSGRRRHVVDAGVDLAGGDVALVVGAQLGERAGRLAERGQHVQRGQHPGVGEPEVAEVVVRRVLAAEDGAGVGHLGLDERVADPGADGCAPASAMISGTACDVITLWTIRMSPTGVPFAASLAISRVATSAVIALGLTGSPRSSMTKQRSASPSNASPMSAPCSTTAACRSRRFSGSSGFASWFGNVPSSSKYSGTTSAAAGQPGAGAEDGGHGVAAHAVAGVDDHLQRPVLAQVDQRAQELGVVGEDVALRDGPGGPVAADALVRTVERRLRQVADLGQPGVLADRARARRGRA